MLGIRKAKRRASIALTALALLASCGKSEDTRAPQAATPAEPAPVSFSDQSANSVVQQKYETATLLCELRAQKAIRFNDALPAADALSWDLLREEPTARSYQLKASGTENHSFTLWVDFSSVSLIQGSPAIDLEYRYEDEILDQRGISDHGSGRGTSRIVENRMNKVLALEYRPDRTADAQNESEAVSEISFLPRAPSKSIFIDFRCQLRTTLLNP
jgi:hypothetical protein